MHNPGRLDEADSSLPNYKLSEKSRNYRHARPSSCRRDSALDAQDVLLRLEADELVTHSICSLDKRPKSD